MSGGRPGLIPAIAAGIVAFAVIIAAYVVARTPGDVVSGDLTKSAPPSQDHQQVDYTLPKGRSASEVGQDLVKLQVIRSAKQFKLLASLLGVQDKLSAGDYVLLKDSSAATVLSQLVVKDSVPVLRVTFREGIRVEEMADVAAKAGFGTRQQFLDAVANAKLPPGLEATLPADLPAGPARLEGYLFPDTYIMPKGTSAAQLVDLMIKTLDQKFTPELRAAAQAQGLNPHQALTMASIVEREAVLANERALIAGVFYNRLAAGDLLGADPTVQFAASLDPASVEKYGWWKTDLTIDDLENRSPYNTRLFPGLPPGPITNPGLASIEAVSRPSKTKDYYFVANAKKADGSHVFAETLPEHEQNKVEFGAP